MLIRKVIEVHDNMIREILGSQLHSQIENI